jgi:hypothetical protein
MLLISLSSTPSSISHPPSVLPSIQEFLHGTISWLPSRRSLCGVVSQAVFQIDREGPLTVFSELATLKVKLWVTVVFCIGMGITVLAN